MLLIFKENSKNVGRRCVKVVPSGVAKHSFYTLRNILQLTNNTL